MHNILHIDSNHSSQSCLWYACAFESVFCTCGWVMCMLCECELVWRMWVSECDVCWVWVWCVSECDVCMWVWCVLGVGVMCEWVWCVLGVGVICEWVWCVLGVGVMCELVWCVWVSVMRAGCGCECDVKVRWSRLKHYLRCVIRVNWVCLFVVVVIVVHCVSVWDCLQND